MCHIVVMQCICVKSLDNNVVFVVSHCCDAMYLCKITRSQCSLCCVRKPSVKIYFLIYHLGSRPGTAQMRIILRNTKNQVYSLTCITRTKCVFCCRIDFDAMYWCKITRSQCSLNSKTREKNSSNAFQQLIQKSIKTVFNFSRQMHIFTAFYKLMFFLNCMTRLYMMVVSCV